MKKTALAASLLILVSVISFGQSDNPVFSKEDYLKKRSKNNTTAHILLWTGFAASLTGSTIDQQVNFDGPRGLFGFRTRGSHPYKHAGAAIACTGVIAMAGSVPFFVLASKNKKKAIQLSVKNEPVPQLTKQDIVSRSVPALSLKLYL